MEKTKDMFMKNGTTLFLRTAVLGIGLIVLIFCVVMLMAVYQDWTKEFPRQADWQFPVMFVMSTGTITFFVAVAQILKLLNLIDKNKSFSNASVKAMKNVQYCGYIISVLFATWLPLVYFIAQEEDAPGMILIFGAIFVAVPLVVGVLAAVAKRLFQNAIDIKKENDLTV
ncbi:MAG TPA: DUF2975 domain-containing protein [Candidatus Limnocylindria bacterium]|nr:DUF2975 domain-containing protein [Candidatus Limnocylindria bacterium]